MLEIKRAGFRDLTEEQREEQPDNGAGKEYANYLRITHGGKTIKVYSDAMEPEDCSFNRDLHWFAGAIEAAYELGKSDA